MTMNGRWRRFKRPAWRWLKRVTFASAVTAVLGMGALLLSLHLTTFPIDRLEAWPSSPLVTDRSGREMLCLVGQDDQWRFPVDLADMSPWLTQATIAVEDERFRRHPGVDPLAVMRAVGQNVRACRVISGASTITMQVCRMMDDRPRTWRAKMIESFRALQLERAATKDEILETYLNIAPYGRNLRGAEAASRIYFGKPASELSLGEAALLAGLPQSPSRYRPDRYPERARARRDTVLDRMTEVGMITPLQADRAAAEPIVVPDRTRQPLGMHAAWLALQRRPGGAKTTIDAAIQREVERVTFDHTNLLPRGSDIAVVVIDIDRGDIAALIGSADPTDPIDGQVNGATARRSPGSTLKPFIYAAAFEAKRLDPQSMVYDVPIERHGWSPANFERGFAGELSAADALQRSLNVPAILVAEGTGLPRCLGFIESAGVALPDDALSRGGLAVVVGALEVTLLDLVNGYATLGRGGSWQRPRLFIDDPVQRREVLDANVCAAIDEMLSSRHRRPSGAMESDLDRGPWFMWKTGTSSGRRDAWAVGHNHRYAIGVWVGNFSGRGNAAFVGSRAAEPLLARLFRLPAIRVNASPASYQPWAVANPLPPPPELTDALRITSPANGATFVAVAGGTVIHPRATRTAGISWFLDGELLSPSRAERLTVPPGRHELLAIRPDGHAARVTFDVRDGNVRHRDSIANASRFSDLLD